MIEVKENHFKLMMCSDDCISNTPRVTTCSYERYPVLPLVSLSYLGEISVLGHANVSAPRSTLSLQLWVIFVCLLYMLQV